MAPGAQSGRAGSEGASRRIRRSIAHCPASGRWTARREREYQESLELIQDLAVQRSRQSASVNLVFI